jgi:hypothetical protein
MKGHPVLSLVLVLWVALQHDEQLSVTYPTKEKKNRQLQRVGDYEYNTIALEWRLKFGVSG